MTEPTAIPEPRFVHADRAPDPDAFAVVQLGKTELLSSGFEWGQSGWGDEGAGSALFMHDTSQGSLLAEASVPAGQAGRAYGTVKLQKWFRVEKAATCADESRTATISMRLSHAAQVSGNNYTMGLGGCLAEGDTGQPQRAWMDWFAVSPQQTTMDRPYEHGTETIVLPNVKLQAGKTYCIVLTVAILAQGAPSGANAPASGADVVFDPAGFAITDTFVTFTAPGPSETILA